MPQELPGPQVLAAELENAVIKRSSGVTRLRLRQFRSQLLRVAQLRVHLPPRRPRHTCVPPRQEKKPRKGAALERPATKQAMALFQGRSSQEAPQSRPLSRC